MDNITYEERLMFLRSNTILGPISLIKLAKVKSDIEKARLKYYKVEGDLMDYEFAVPEKYEYDLRFESWKYDCMDLWVIHSDGLGLYEFSERVMDQQIAREKLSKKKVRK